MRLTDIVCAACGEGRLRARRISTASCRWAAALLGVSLLPVAALAQSSPLPGLFDGTVRCLAQDGSTFYAGADGRGVYSSVGGTGWTSFSDGAMSPQTVLSLAVDPFPATHLVFAGTGSGGVLKASVGSPSWTAVSGVGAGALGSLTVSALGVDPAGDVYAGTAAGLFVTTAADLGATTWSPISTVTGPVSSIAIVNGNRIYVGSGTSVISTLNGFGSVSSHDFGQTVSALIVKGGASASGSADILYVGTNTGVFISSNGGGAWSSAQTAGLSSTKILSLALDAANNRLYAGEDTGGIFIATPSGSSATFAPSGTGLPCDGLSPPCPSSPASGAILALLVNPGGFASTDILLAGTGNGSVFRTTNGGSTWSSAGPGIPFKVNALCRGFESPGSATMAIAATDHNVFKLAHGATSWTLKLVPTTARVNAVASNPNTGRIYVGVNGSSQANVFTIDYTAGSPIWQSFKSIAGADVTALANDGQANPTTYIGTAANFVAKCVNAVPAADGSDCVADASGALDPHVNAIALDANFNPWAGTDGGIITLGGSTWAADAMAGAPTVPIRSLAVAQSGPAAPLFVFAGTDSDVLRRDSAWSVLTGLTLTGGAQAILADPFGDVYVGTGGNGIQRSADFGVTWSDFSAGLPAGTSVTALAITGSTLYTGTAAGGTFSAPVSLPVSVPEVHGGLPASFAVGPCFPDPARGSTTLQFALPAASVVTLSIYDVQGHRMAQPLDHILEQPGVYDVPVRSDPWKPGMYFYRLVAGDRSAARKFVVLK